MAGGGSGGGGGTVGDRLPPRPLGGAQAVEFF